MAAGSKRPAIVLLATLTACAFHPRPAEVVPFPCSGFACASLRASGRESTFVVENRAPVDLTLRPRAGWAADWARCCEVLDPPTELVLAPGETRDAMRFRRRLATSDAIRALASLSSAPPFDVYLGSTRTRPDPAARYAFPFGGSAPRLLAFGEGGPTHAGALRFAFDFALPEGTPVLAAREGTVVQVVDGFTQGGLDPALRAKGNCVVVAHADGTLALYGHLESGIEVAVGDEVVRGTRLGASGHTGFASGPHLHFQVGLISGEGEGATIPIRFEGPTAAGLALVPGRFYGPGVPAADGGAPHAAARP